MLCVLENIKKQYSRGSAVLGPLSLCIKEGEILGISGENGTGKSTLIKLIANVIKPDDGRVIIDKNARNKVAYIPQDIALYENLSGIDNLRFWGHLYGIQKKQLDARCGWLLEQMNLTQKANELVCSYSGGMKRRLHLATALVQTPSLLLLDEPTVGSDEQSAELILDIILNLSKKGCGVVFVSHQAGELQKICDRICCLENGILINTEEVDF
ncbi:MAG: ABC transporter ATP-binding protein [Oscillospiraceae bacterium]